MSSSSGLLTSDIYNASSKEFVTVVSRFKPQREWVPFNTVFLNQVEQNIDFVLGTYLERKDYSEQLRKQLRREALEYAEQSLYFEVRRLDETTFLPQELLATMKIVEVGPWTPIKILPMEADFNIELPFNGKRKFETANLASNKAQNKLGKSEIFTQLILHAREQLQSPDHEANKMMYYTPVDSAGAKMYGKLSFTSVPGFERKEFEEDDKKWRIFGATAEDLAQLPEFLAKNKSQWSLEDIDWIEQLLKNFTSLQGTKTEISGVRSKNLQVRQGSVKEMGVFVSEPFTYAGKNYRRLSVLSMNNGDI
ncbi:MAG TPA: hypothetical protein VN132_01530, partial [Bdellovibrio sp.]|nr:hypothetical protein [Bdellovibrio sp.]